MNNVTHGFVVACDGSNHSAGAAKVAAELAKATGQPFKLLTVFSSARIERKVISGKLPEHIDEEVQRYAREVFAAAKEVIGDAATPAEEVLLRGDPAKEILDYMECNPGSHLVLGRRGHSLLRSLTLGSVSEKVVRHAVAPVTVVNG